MNEKEYLLVLWPWCQELMKYDWFRKECYLLLASDDQEQFDGAYFVPKHRLEKIKDELQFMQQLYDVIRRSKEEE
jgi:hypothetical protein